MRGAPSLHTMKRFTLAVASLLLAFAAPSVLAGIQYPKATFSGIIGGDTFDQQGRFTIKTTSTGAFTVKVKVGPKSAAFHGQFDENFHVDQKFTFRPLPFVSIDVRVIMDMTPDGERIRGTVQSEAINDNSPVPFTVYQVFKYTTQNPAPQAGRFTGLFTKIDGTSPTGTGVAIVNVSKTGKVKVVGTLPDGSKVSTGGGLSPGGVFPIFNVLYSKKGALAGFAQFHGENAADTNITVAGQTDTAGLVWAKIGDGDFTGHEKLVLERYTAPAAGDRVLPGLNANGNGAATFGLTGGGISTFNKQVTFSTTNKVTVTDANNNEGLKVTVDVKTGLVTGSLTLDDKRTFAMVVLQSDDVIRGFHTGTGGTGDASITPNP